VEKPAKFRKNDFRETSASSFFSKASTLREKQVVIFFSLPQEQLDIVRVGKWQNDKKLQVKITRN
jgi:hypothetical protein